MRLIVGLLAALFIASLPQAEEQGEVMNEAKTTQTLCLGRFLIDVPKDIRIIGQSADYGDSIAVTKATQEQMEAAIRAREQQITAPDSLEYLHKRTPGAKPGSQVLVHRLKDYKFGGLEIGYDLHGYFRLSGNQYRIDGKASYNRVDEAIGEMLATIALAAPLRLSEVPEVPGFCMEGAFFAGEPRPHFEVARIYFQLKRHPDVFVRIYTHTIGEKDPEGMLARVKQRSKTVPAELKWLQKEYEKRQRILREGLHPAGDIQGEETLESIALGDSFSTHSFSWEFPGKPRDIYAPKIVIEMESGTNIESGIVRPTVTDNEAIEIFDAIVNSIRVRPIFNGKSMS